MIKTIETSYAGCRFRSRLEARWAVFFDHLGIPWEYEPEGIEFDGVRYLPDFLLPDRGRGLYVEVKGHATATCMERVAALARADHPVLLLGPVPREDASGPHFTLYELDCGQLTRWSVSMFPGLDHPYALYPFGWPERTPLHQLDTSHFQREADYFNLTHSTPGAVEPSGAIGAAFTVARSARFGHGETGR